MIPLMALWLQLENASRSVYVAGCQTSLGSEAKHGRANCIEIAIAEPRSVVVFGCENPADAELWVNELNDVKVEVQDNTSVEALSEEQTAVRAWQYGCFLSS